MEIVVKGRHDVVVPDHFRQHVEDKFTKVERFDHKVIRLDVELAHERNPRQSDHCQRVEVTLRSKGPVVRAEATAPDFYQALEMSLNKLEQRMRRAADRRHKRTRGHEVSASAVADLVAREGWPVSANGIGEPPAPEPEPASAEPAAHTLDGTATTASAVATIDDVDQHGLAAPFVVREKLHSAEPMTLDQALFEMELVGHDFYLYADADSGLPSVVYRRRGYDYGVIRLAK